MSASLDRLTREVGEMKEQVNSAAEKFGKLAEQIRQLKDDPAKLEALADDLDAQQATLKSAGDAASPPDEPPAEPPA